jgi:O-antigen ligase
MEMLAVVTFALVIVTILALYAPQWWIGALIFIMFANFPVSVPPQVQLAGFNIYLDEVPLFLGALYLLIYRPPNRNTDWFAAGIGAIAVVGVAYGLWNGNDLAPVMNDARGSLAMALSVFIVGRIASTPQAHIALQAVKITLWVSFAFVLLGAWGIVTLSASARAEDASLAGEAFHDTAQVTRILGQSTFLASATLAVVIAMWAIRPDLIRQTIGYFIPALGITVMGFSRNALVLVGVTLLLTPLIHRGLASAERGRPHKGPNGLVGAAVIAVVGVIAFVITGAFLSLTTDIHALDYLRLVHSAYQHRVLEGFGITAQQYDYSTLYRQGEVEWLKRAIVGHELFGNGFGFRYRPAFGTGFSATSGTYFAHQFYWWAVAKIGWCGLIAYMIAFVTPVLHALFGHGRFALRSAAAAAVVGFLFTNTVVPMPESPYAAPVLGGLLAIALLCAPVRGGTNSDPAVSLPEVRSTPHA